MKAAIYIKYGSPDVLYITDIKEPEINEGEVLVNVKYTSVNPVDWKFRKGNRSFITGNKFPRITGSDFSGIIEESKLQGFVKGDEVMGFINPIKKGTTAEYIKTVAGNIYQKPENLDFKQTAALPLVGITAIQSLIRKAKLKEGQKVFINGGSGGVGSIAIQIAKYYKCNITATCSTKSIPFVKDFGAHEIIDYTKDDIYSGNDYDVVFDTIGNLSFSKAKRMMKSKASFVTIAPIIYKLLTSRINNIFCGKKIHIVIAASTEEDLKLLKEITEKLPIKPYIHKLYKLEEIQEAHIESESGKVKGKIVIEL